MTDLGPWGAWRSVIGEIIEASGRMQWTGHPIADDLIRIVLATGAKIHLDAVGWSV